MDRHLKHVGTIQPLDQRHREFGLVAGGSPLATLRLGNPHGSWATAEAGGALLLFRRDRVFKKQVAVHEHGKDEPLATLHADVLCRGHVVIDGTEYQWAPTNKRWTQWAWRDAQGHEVAHIKLRHGPLTMRGDVLAASADLSRVQLQLVLLGWYLLLLNHQNFAEHLTAGFDIYLGRLATAVRRR